ncbi:MAG: asparagine synthase (glutamine-hydrolyzing) [Gammaproteobacteria bacterium]
MCGIFGIVVKDPTFSQFNIKELNNLAKHRGPDDEGYFHQHNVHLAHRRLSILDVSSSGHQPMSLMQRYTITYNGEIYNYIEIRKELSDFGYTFQTDTDTEVILVAYKEWGRECVKKFNGMWAFAIYDSIDQELFVSRDRFGEKPFYFIENEKYYAFASEIKQLLPLMESRCVNFRVTAEFLLHGKIEHSSQTFFEGISKLPASSTSLINCVDFRKNESDYYSLAVDEFAQSLGLELATEHYNQALAESVKLRLRSDVRVGACLSGGLDSSSVVGMVSKILPKEEMKNFVAITAQSIETITDETVFAKAVVDKLESDWLKIKPATEEFIDLLDEVAYTQEEPFEGPSIFMQYLVMKASKRAGCKVMLDGQGGDETLLGYENHIIIILRDLLYRFKFLEFISIVSAIQGFRLSRIRIICASVINLGFSWKEKIRYAMKNRLIKDSAKKLEYNSEESPYSATSIFSYQKHELMSTQLPILLRYEDKNSMRHSVETRLPFLDFNLVNLACSINVQHKVSQGYMKYLLRKSVESILPASVVWRKTKYGFEAPTDLWLSKIRGEMLKCINESKLLEEFSIDYSKLNNRQLWRYFSVAKWESVYKVAL